MLKGGRSLILFLLLFIYTTTTIYIYYSLVFKSDRPKKSGKLPPSSPDPPSVSSWEERGGVCVVEGCVSKGGPGAEAMKIKAKQALEEKARTVELLKLQVP